MNKKIVHLSFDLEEFDTPKEYGVEISDKDMFDISIEGTRNILKIINKYKARSTFFTTVNFARRIPDEINDIINYGHELASHGVFHSGVSIPQLLESREALEEISGKKILGFRAPRMGALSIEEVKKAGYAYDSSLNPCFIPGRYNKFSAHRNIHKDNDVYIVPASVSPVVRIPLFWLTFHNFPLSIYKMLCRSTIEKDGHIVLYFHPWEFTNLHKPELKMPYIIKNNCGEKMIERLSNLIEYLAKYYDFAPICENKRLSL